MSSSTADAAELPVAAIAESAAEPTSGRDLDRSVVLWLTNLSREVRQPEDHRAVEVPSRGRLGCGFGDRGDRQLRRVGGRTTHPALWAFDGRRPELAATEWYSQGVGIR